MSVKVKGGKAFIIVLIALIVIAVATCAIVPSVRTFVFNLFKTEEQKLTEKTKKLKEQIQQDDRYKELSDDNKQKVEDKFKQITNSEKYIKMTDEEKDEIVDKLIESEKIQQDIQKEQEEQETRKEELKQELEDLSSNKQELEQRVQDLKDSGATDEEIKAAEEEQQKVEEQIKAAEQEQIYYETSDTVKDAMANNKLIQVLYGTTIQKVWGIYKCGGHSIYVNADILQKETIAGVDIYTKANALCHIMIIIPEETTEAILECLSNPDSILIESICTNKNAGSHKEYFEQNKQTMCEGTLKRYEDVGCEMSILETWEEDNDSEHPSFLLRVKRGQDVDMLEFLRYGESSGEYSLDIVEKICPEFWAQLETEQAEAQNENLKNRFEFSTLDKEGNTISFDYSSYLLFTKTNIF